MLVSALAGEPTEEYRAAQLLPSSFDRGALMKKIQTGSVCAVLIGIVEVVSQRGSHKS
jgi:hypothetical protein